MKVSRSALWVLGALVVLVAALWYTSRAVTPKEATREDVLAEARAGGYRILDTEELWEYYRQGAQDLEPEIRPVGEGGGASLNLGAPFLRRPLKSHLEGGGQGSQTAYNPSLKPPPPNPLQGQEMAGKSRP